MSKRMTWLKENMHVNKMDIIYKEGTTDVELSSQMMWMMMNGSGRDGIKVVNMVLTW